jgi:hypothetical protein
MRHCLLLPWRRTATVESGSLLGAWELWPLAAAMQNATKRDRNGPTHVSCQVAIGCTV